MMLYKAMNLKTQKEVTRAARPSLGQREGGHALSQATGPAAPTPPGRVGLLKLQGQEPSSTDLLTAPTG